ncbi:MAG: NAD(P)/FAD-dependent oxidoreductase, partial [Pseudomonadota bacterium]
MQTYDNIIIGAGHNGLVCAAHLARAGQSVLVLEAASAPGGLAASREFHPGFRCAVAHSLNHLSQKVVSGLDLARHGFRGAGEVMDTVALDTDGEHVRISGSTVSGVSATDAGKYSDYHTQMKRFAGALAPSWLKTMPRIGDNSAGELWTFASLGLKLRLLGKADMREFLRVFSLPARDLMDENFDSELLKAALSWEGLIGSTQAPRSPNSTVLTMLYRMLGAHDGAHSLPPGGIQNLVDALVRAASAYGAEIRCDAPVQQVLIEGGDYGQRCVGVALADGSELRARYVISAADPRTTFLQLVGTRHLEIDFANRMHRFRSKGYVAKLHLALDGAPVFTGLGGAGHRMIIAPTMDSIEFAWDAAKFGQCPEQPVMEIVLPSLRDASLAPPGKHVLSAHVMYIPQALREGWSEDARTALINKLLVTLERYAPGIGDLVLHAELLTPADIESDWRVSGGHWHHGE